MKKIKEIDKKITNFLFKGYTVNNLVYGERIKFQSRKHWINFFNLPLILFLLFSLVYFKFLLLITVLLINLVYLYITIKTDECIVTSKRVIFKTGFFNTSTLEMNLTKIESLMVDQSILGKILGYGTIHIKGTGGTLETFLRINKPLQIRKKIQENSFN
jgi:uncharacterized membrane protein YdbT with pleckstrin-like domain